MFISLACSVLFGLSQRTGDFIVAALLGLVQLVMRINPMETFSAIHADIFDRLPSNIASTYSKFNLDGRVTVYAVCPKCHALYTPEGSYQQVFPKICTFQITPDVIPCGEPLLSTAADLSEADTPNDTKPKKPIPIKTFHYHSFNDYVASLLAREDIETLCDNICDETLDALCHGDPQFMRTVFDASFVRSFPGPTTDPTTGQPQLFSHREGELRLIFSLSIDGFPAEGSRKRSAAYSCGIITMMCLNLPLNLCSKPEYMYVAGIIPGPTEPHDVQLNHYIRPLIDELTLSYERGVFYSCTAKSRRGRLTRSAVVLSVNDLPAARKISQLGWHRSHFYCTVCCCYHLSTLGRTD